MPALVQKIKDALTTPRSKRFVAVDFDSNQLRIVLGERVGKSTRVLRLAAEPLPDGLSPTDAQAIGTFLGETLSRMKIAAPGIVMSVPRSLCVLKPLTLPPGTAEDEMSGMVQFQMAKELPFRPEEAVIDFTIERHFDAETAGDSDPQGVHVLVAAVRVPVVDFYRQIAISAKVKLQRLGLRPYANRTCVVRCAQIGPDEQVAAVHLTSDETSIDVLTGGALVFSRATMGKIPSPGSAADSEIDEAVRSVVIDAARSLQSYQTVEGSGQIARIYVAGGTGVERKVCDGLAGRLGVQCSILDPARSLGLEGGGDASEFISALGLAIQHSGDEGLPFDFLRPKRPVVRRDMRKWRIRAAAACAVLVAASAIAGGKIYIARKETVVKDLRETLKKVEKANKRVKKLASRARAVEQWQEGSCAWLDHWAYINALFPSATEAFINPSPGLKGHEGTFSFIVRTDSSDGITDVAKRLKDAGYNAKISRLLATEETKYPYSADVKLTFTPTMKIDLSSVKAATRPADDTGRWPAARPGRSRGRTR